MLLVRHYHAFIAGKPFGLDYAHIGGDKFMHVQVGLTLWVVSALALRRPLRAPVPLMVVIAAECANELMDRLYYGRWWWRDTIGDAASTWLWPVTLFLLLNLVPRLRR